MINNEKLALASKALWEATQSQPSELGIDEHRLRLYPTGKLDFKSHYVKRLLIETGWKYGATIQSYGVYTLDIGESNNELTDFELSFEYLASMTV